MARLHVYARDEIAEAIRRRAEARGIPVSRYLGELIERQLAQDWPEGYFERVVGGMEGQASHATAPGRVGRHAQARSEPSSHVMASPSDPATW